MNSPGSLSEERRRQENESYLLRRNHNENVQREQEGSSRDAMDRMIALLYHDGGSDISQPAELERTGLDQDESLNNDDPMPSSSYPSLQNAFTTTVLPPQLHPAAAMGMQRVSSCYFSIQSNTSQESDLCALYEDLNANSNHSESDYYEEDACIIDWGENDSNESEQMQHTDAPLESTSYTKTDQEKKATATTTKGGTSGVSNTPTKRNAAHVLYHDIMMHVFTFLDAHSLAAFSETARRPNFELQLQRALLYSLSPSSSTYQQQPMESLSTIGGAGAISRLAAVDQAAAQAIMQGYLDSNSSLRTMPLSHSLAYLRHVLMRHVHTLPPDKSHAMAASAAMLVTVLGAASYMGSNAHPFMDMHAPIELTDVMKQGILKLGLAGCGLMGVGVKAREKFAEHKSGDSVSSSQDQDQGDIVPYSSSPPSIVTNATTKSVPREGRSQRSHFPQRRSRHHLRSSSSMVNLDRVDEVEKIVEGEEPQKEAQVVSAATADAMMDAPFTPNPYEHVLPETALDSEAKEEDVTGNEIMALSLQHEEKVGDHSKNKASSQHETGTKMPSGCVGAYTQAVRQALEKVTHAIKEERKNMFLALSEEEQQQLATAFIDACSSDENLQVVKDILGRSMDVDGFFVGSDGTETCALHSAAFNGATAILEYLCEGVDQEFDGSSTGGRQRDGGLCDIDLRDNNGWTAMHFAAGANSAAAVKILASCGAKMNVEANNGYTPYHWAERLSNREVLEEFQHLGADNRFIWSFGSPSNNNNDGTAQGNNNNRLASFFANRFFSTRPVFTH
eukprot:scaffold147951_cov59-Attheya_sp.AAC.1